MTADEVFSEIKRFFENRPGYDDAKAHQFSATIAETSKSVALQAAARTVSAPTPQQQTCYADCQTTRDGALAEAATRGFPGGLIAAASAVLAFNNCRHNCDTA